MKKVHFGLRILLSIVLIFFGANQLFQFFVPPPFADPAHAYFTALINTGYMIPFIGIFKIVIGLMLLANFRTALALVILAPFSVNIVLFHVFLDVASIIPALLVFILNIVLSIPYKKIYAPLMAAETKE